MSKTKITDDEFIRFEHLIWRVWHVYEFGQDKNMYNEMTNEEIENVNQIFTQLKQSHPREYDIIIRHYLKRVYYTTIAREQGVSEGYIRKLCKNGAYYFLELYDKK
ncbi:antiterminator Q family protein [Lactococcus sp. DD01]|uniref:antiterminator Q family protein n=1 Tax=Lactococcus sp. DD01 TaxID=1776443 RepID=UPI00077624C4|nr:antiterminator Q family protein [Lactococcus sp. DD01]